MFYGLVLRITHLLDRFSIFAASNMGNVHCFKYSFKAMLFKQKQLKGIRSGTVSLAFRKWRTPVVKAGSRHHTPIGLVEILEITKVEANSISEVDAINAGYGNRNELFSLLNSFSEGDIYRISVRFHSEDPRIEMREKSGISGQDFEVLKARLDKLDRYSREGVWTMAVLLAIRDHPQLRAAELVLVTGKQKEWLKVNIRKLKNLGLTISHETGYSLSPLGEAFLDMDATLNRLKS